MPIRFRCVRCQKLLSIGTRKAGTPIQCPTCLAEMMVPWESLPEQCLEPKGKITAKMPSCLGGLPAGPATWFGNPGRTMLESPSQDPHSAVEDPLSQLPKSTEKFWPKVAAVATLASFGLILVVGVMAAYSGGKPANKEVARITPRMEVLENKSWPKESNLPKEIKTSTEMPKEMKTGPKDLPKLEEKPIAATVILPAKTEDKIQKPEPAAVIQDKAKANLGKPRPKQAPARQEKNNFLREDFQTQEIQAEPARFVFKRRWHTTDEGLRKQLLLVPETGIDTVPGTSQRLVHNSRLPMNQGRDLMPALVSQRPDLATLPMRMGVDCRLGKEPAEALQTLSQKLRGHLGISQLKRPGEIQSEGEVLRSLLFNEGPLWLQPEAIPTLNQLLMAGSKGQRLVLVDLLAKIPGRTATESLANRALADLHPEVREAALAALKTRPREEYADFILQAFTYPWPAIAEHAAEALIALQIKEAVPHLIALLDVPDPALPFEITIDKKKKMVVRELVRINHLSNCLLCHPPSFNPTDLVRGRVPIPGQPLTEAPQAMYGGGDQGTFVRADITYLKQDFSVTQPVAGHGPWPAYQRYDYLVRFRPALPKDLPKPKPAEGELAPEIFPQKDSVLFALRELTGRDLGLTSEDWRPLLAKNP